MTTILDEMPDDRFRPVMMVQKTPDGKFVTILNNLDGSLDHRHFGSVICDSVRHIAKAFDVSEDDVWEWVEKERAHPTTEILPLRAQ